ncbi:MAG: hypothetical protein ACREQI_12030 [Candidatus Binataceae bacterium]
MNRYSLLALPAILMAGCNFSPTPLRTLNTVGGTRVNSAVESTLMRKTTSLVLKWNSAGQPDRLAIADVITYGGAKPAITPPGDWHLIRDDTSPATRQSLYWHVIRSCDPNMQMWRFSVPTDAQGAMLVLDGFDSKRPIDVSGGNTGGGFVLKADSIETRHDGDLILGFFATDFHGFAPGHTSPRRVAVLLDRNQAGATHDYWVLGAYQQNHGRTGDMRCVAGQVFNWAAAQVAIRRREPK